MTIHTTLRRALLVAGCAMLPFSATAQIDSEGVYIQSPEQEQPMGLGGIPVDASVPANASVPVVAEVDAVGNTVVVEPAPAPVQPQHTLQGVVPPVSESSPLSGEPNPARTAVNDELLSEQRVGDITYITGGIGEAERQAMERLRPRYNLRVTNAEKQGAFISDVVVSVLDSKGAELFSTATDPLFLANLPAGRYTVKAERNGQSKTQTVQLAKGKTAQIQFAW